MVPAVNNIVPKSTKITHSAFWMTAKMNGQLFGVATAFPTGTVIGPPFKGNFQSATAINFTGILHLSAISQLFNRHLVHLSSDLR